MGKKTLTKFTSFLAFSFVSLCIASGVYFYAFSVNLAQLTRTGSVQLEQAADRLLGQLAPFQQLSNVLAKHPQVFALFADAPDIESSNNFLANTALTVGADAIFVLDRAGRILAASDFENPERERSHNFENAPYVRQALNGSLGFHRGFDSGTQKRKFYFARGVILERGKPAAVVVVQVDVAQLEFEWEGDDSVLAFLDEVGVVFVTNRIELRLNVLGRGFDRAAAGIIYPETLVPEFSPFVKIPFGLGTARQGTRNPVLPRRVLDLSEFMPRIDMTAHIFLNARDAEISARVYGVLALTLMAMVGLGLLALGQRRKRLAERLIIEAAANARLEARVEERTQQLRATQDQLVQAGKLTALGQMSAGISHELNQPLAAIRNFAQNGVKLIERERTEEASENLGRIAVQVDRIDRIIRNLRGFARKEQEVIEPVNLVTVVKDAEKLAEPRLKSEGVNFVGKGLDQPLLVMGGPVRLQQVIVNLITNSMDAMVDQSSKQISLTARKTGSVVELVIADNGPGLDDPDRAFEPFYTTKDIGASKGLGLGLSISYGIIGSFGGELKCRNLSEGGAEFSICLPIAEEQK